MANLDAQVRESQEQVAEAQNKIAELTSRIETARAKLKAGDDAMIDIENATLEDVHAHTEVMNANIAELIMGLDDVTAGFSRDFDEMRNKTGMETFIGIFSRAKADSMRQERIRSASIDDKLQDLIGKSDVIVQLLEGQLAMLEEQKVKVESNLTETLDEREMTVGELETIRADIGGMDPDIIKLENAIASEADAAKRTKLETELAEANAKYNALVQEEQVKLAKSQTLERYIEKGKTWIDSLQNQAATQMVLINKLQTDTKQRVVLYDALTKSLKTAQQQDVAHRINEIGVKTDQEAQSAMAGIGSATNARMAEMMEKHEDHMVFAREVLERKPRPMNALPGGLPRSSRNMTAISMAAEKEHRNRHSGNLLSDRGRRELLISISLVGLPPLLMVVFNIGIGANFYSLGLLIAVFLIIRTWSRELNWLILKRRFFNG